MRTENGKQPENRALISQTRKGYWHSEMESEATLLAETHVSPTPILKHVLCGENFFQDLAKRQ